MKKYEYPGLGEYLTVLFRRLHITEAVFVEGLHIRRDTYVSIKEAEMSKWTFWSVFLFFYGVNMVKNVSVPRSSVPWMRIYSTKVNKKMENDKSFVL